MSLELIQMLTVANQQPSEVGIAMTTHYHFDTDEAGNMFVPASVFGGEMNVRIKISPRKKIVMDVVQAISSITNKDREEAGQTWRNFSVKTRTLIQSDLLQDESKCLKIVK
jgi:hypothetical protein